MKIKIKYMWLALFLAFAMGNTLLADNLDNKDIVITSANNSQLNYYLVNEYAGMQYYYTNITINGAATNEAYTITINNLDNTNYYAYEIVVTALSGKKFDSVKDLVPVDGTISHKFTPSTDETGICIVSINRKSEGDNSKYEFYKEHNGIRLVPQHKIQKDLSGYMGYNTDMSYDYTIYFTNDEFAGINEVSMSDFLQYLEESYIDSWEKMVHSWGLCKDVSYKTPAPDSETVEDRPIDADRSIEIIVYDGKTSFHRLNKKSNEFDIYYGKSFSYIDPNKKMIFIPVNLKETNGFKKDYANVEDAIATSVAAELYHIIQQSLNQTFSQPANWIYKAQALAMQSIVTDELDAEFKRQETEYPLNVNSFLEKTDSKLVPDTKTNGDEDDKLRYSLYWRFLYENIIPDANSHDALQIFKKSFTNAYTGNLKEVNSYMTESLRDIDEGIYKSFEHSWLAYTEKVLYLDGKSITHWGRWKDNIYNVYKTPVMESSYSWEFNNKYDGLIKSNIINPLGMKFHIFKTAGFFDIMKDENINFEFLGNNNADWGVVVYLVMENMGVTKDDAPITYVLPVENSKNKKKAIFNLRKKLVDIHGFTHNIEEMRIAVVRLDANQNQASDYTITWKKATGQELYILNPISETPTIVNMQEDNSLTVDFTVLTTNGEFVGDIDTKKINLVTDNGTIVYSLSITEVNKVYEKYNVTAILPTDLPAGYYNVEVQAENSEDGTPLSFKTPNSLLIRNTFGCSGQYITMQADYITGMKPVIELDKPGILITPFEAGIEVDVDCHIFDNDTITDARIWFRKTNTENYYYFELEKGVDNKYSIALPDSIIKFPGVDFYLSATDKYGNYVTLPEIDPKINPFQIIVEENEAPFVEVVNEPELTLLSYDNPISFEVHTIDTNDYIHTVGIRYRIFGQVVWNTIEYQMQSHRNDTINTFEIPAGFSGMKSIEYYIYSVDNYGIVGYYGSETYPKYLDFVLPAPKLIYPNNADTLITYSVDFKWENLEETYSGLAYFYEYWLEISEDAEFTDPIIDELYEVAFANIKDLEYNKVYYWRVRGFVDSDESGWSPARTFVLNRPVPQITEINFTDRICINELLYMEVITNDGEWSYNWYKNNEIIADQNTATLVINQAQVDDGGVYYCQVSNMMHADSVKSDNAEIIVFDKPDIVEQPQNQSAKISYSAKFDIKINALGFAPDNEPIINWFKEGVEIVPTDRITLEHIADTDVYSLRIININENDYSNNYYVRIKDRCDSSYTISDEFALLRGIDSTKIKILSQPANQKICKGEDAILSINLSVIGSGDLTYQWFKNGNELEEGTDYSGTQTADLTVKNFSNMKAGNYYVKIKIMPDNVEYASSTAIVSLMNEPTIINQSSTIENGQEGATLVLFVNAIGDNLSFQWYKNSSLIAGESDRELIIRNYDVNDEGIYLCKVSNICKSVNSTNIRVVDIQEEAVISNILSISPNPVVSTSDVKLSFESNYNIRLILADMTGQEISTVFEGMMNAGNHIVSLDMNKYNISAGNYFILLQYDNKVVTIPIIFIK